MLLTPAYIAALIGALVVGSLLLRVALRTWSTQRQVLTASNAPLTLSRCEECNGTAFNNARFCAVCWDVLQRD